MTFVTVLTQFHTATSIIAIGAGAVVMIGLFRVCASRFWTNLFLATAMTSSVTGFFFPFSGITPAQITGVVAIAILGVIIAAFYRLRLQGAWRWIYAAGMVASLYLLVFVGIVQAFQKIAFLKGLAPTQSETPFIIAQLTTLVVFVGFGIIAASRFRPKVAVPNV